MIELAATMRPMQCINEKGHGRLATSGSHTFPSSSPGPKDQTTGLGFPRPAPKVFPIQASQARA